jgi:bifunctional pyridoxal-dependent enzyme with beta-cystathionase and maltose regulon repressor activities
VTPMIDYDFYNLYQVPNYSTMTTYLWENSETEAIALVVADMDTANLFDN